MCFPTFVAALCLLHPVIALTAGPVVPIAPGVVMPLVSLGTGSGQKGDVVNATATWIKIGGVGIDTALIYRDQPKVRQGILTAGISASSVFITTKVPCGTYEEVSKGVQESLDQLGVSMVNLTLIHAFPNPQVACARSPGASIKDTWRALVDAKRSGKTRSIGVSSFGSHDLIELQSYGGELPAVNQCSLSVGHHDDETMQLCDKLGITYQSYSPLCGGFNGSSCKHGNVMTLPEVKTIAGAHKVSPAQVALKWIVQQGRPLAVASWLQQYMEEDLDLWSWGNLTDDEMNTLTKVKTSFASEQHALIV
eukprot:TRINITY_DN45481_c0_g1_i1.p1 TRINITY_DN45481_c0_g1~~TRINITY_DN45481_c0_g1_i1.p1  ORF type:complete len:308 (-),score=41.15 TRINITY_DN45481_c0_g1_i1:79-1002(-)